jgi:chromosome partitioning protein
VLTIAAYLTCEKILIPVKPEFLSTIGLPLIRQSIGDFSRLYKKNIEMTGICFNACTNYAPEETKSKEEVNLVADRLEWYVFPEEVPYSRSFPKGG